MPQFAVNGLQIEVETLGNPEHPAVLLIMGLGMQLIAWPEPLCSDLVQAGFYVLRFDNRDIGLSSKIETGASLQLGLNVLRFMLHRPVRAPYSLDAMVDDSVGVLDALHLPAAHIVGVSMGGMIAQNLAARYPQRCLSLASIMSTTGKRCLPQASWKVRQLLIARPPRRAPLEQLVRHYQRLYLAIGSPGFPTPPELLRERLRISLQRNYCPAGTARQLLAVAAADDRSALVARIAVPTLVLHGADDPLLPLAHGIDTARTIGAAKLQVIAGMGHDLAPDLLPVLTPILLQHLLANAKP
jgi:proline iminopeptidase